jgi:hypothetical protein
MDCGAELVGEVDVEERYRKEINRIKRGKKLVITVLLIEIIAFFIVRAAHLAINWGGEFQINQLINEGLYFVFDIIFAVLVLISGGKQSTFSKWSRLLYVIFSVLLAAVSILNGIVTGLVMFSFDNAFDIINALLVFAAQFVLPAFKLFVSLLFYVYPPARLYFTRNDDLRQYKNLYNYYDLHTTESNTTMGVLYKETYEREANNKRKKK